jgi:hypothetical protein
VKAVNQTMTAVETSAGLMQVEGVQDDFDPKPADWDLADAGVIAILTKAGAHASRPKSAPEPEVTA